MFTCPRPAELVDRNADYTDVTLEWKRSQYDLLSRVSAVAMFKGSEPDCQTISNRTGLTQIQYDIDVAPGLPRVRVIDPAGKVRDEERDALGRLTRVVEDAFALNYLTTYTYDPLDNLTQVAQGVQTRAFSYTTLSRLWSAANPESGTTGYAYYASGDLRTRTGASNVVSSFTYDALHRMKTKAYSDVHSARHV